MAVRTALDALTLRPTRLVRGWWPWRSLLYLVTGALFAGPVMLLLFGYTFDGPLPAVGMVALVATPVFGVMVAKV